jgi:hypothetical protein
VKAQCNPCLNLTDQGYWRRDRIEAGAPYSISLELHPPLHLAIELLRFLIHLMPDFIAVPAFEKQYVAQPKSGYTKCDKEENTHGRHSFCNII